MEAIQRFLSKIQITESGCWQWTDSLTQKGYAHIRIEKKKRIAHRWIYEYYHGDICPDLTIDHLCRNRICVNPIHLEQVPMRINNIRGYSPSAINSRKTHCKRNHDLEGEEIRIDSKGHRICLICKAITDKNYYQKNKDRIDVYRKKWMEVNKEKIRIYKRNWIKVKRQSVPLS